MTEHFSENELKCKCGCNELSINPQLLYALEVLRRLIKKPIIINSAYRCKSHNIKVGGAVNSQHPKGNAADIVVKGMAPDSVACVAETIFDGVGRYDTFTHVDVRGFKAKWGFATTPSNNDILPDGPTDHDINNKLGEVE